MVSKKVVSKPQNMKSRRASLSTVYPVMPEDPNERSATQVIPFDPNFSAMDAFWQSRLRMRTMNANEFIERHASGTIRKNRRVGMLWEDQYLEERIAFEFGWTFECMQESRVTWGKARTESDCHELTEAGWHIDRYLGMCVFPGDVVEAKYIQVEYKDGRKKEGIGLIIRRTSAAYIPDRRIVFAIVTEYDRQNHDFLEAKNPC